MTAKRSWHAAIAAVSLVSFGASPSNAEETPTWDAKEVLTLATELDFAISKVLAVAPEVPPQETAFQQRTRDAAVVQMKRAQEASQRFVQKLRLGWNRDETESYFRALSSALREVNRTAGDAVAQEETQPLLARIEQLRFKLEKFYEQR